MCPGFDSRRTHLFIFQSHHNTHCCFWQYQKSVWMLLHHEHLDVARCRATNCASTQAAPTARCGRLLPCADGLRRRIAAGDFERKYRADGFTGNVALKALEGTWSAYASDYPATGTSKPLHQTPNKPRPVDTAIKQSMSPCARSFGRGRHEFHGQESADSC
jgi:hypothetical protein